LRRNNALPVELRRFRNCAAGGSGDGKFDEALVVVV
jgi:hypothetical protein